MLSFCHFYSSFNSNFDLLSLCHSELVLYYYDKADFATIANTLTDLLLTDNLKQLNTSLTRITRQYALLNNDKQFSVTLQEQMKYNNKYIVARKQINNYALYWKYMEDKGTGLNLVAKVVKDLIKEKKEPK